MAEPRVPSRVSTRESLRFLTRAGQTLAASLDYEDTLHRVAQLAVPRVACYCAVDVLEDGRMRRVGMAHVDPGRLDTLRRTAEFPLDLSPGSFLAESFKSGQPRLVSPITEAELRTVARSEEHLALLRELAPTSWILIPLIARDRALGALVLASTRTDRYYGRQDLALATELGRIAALAIDNARLYWQAGEAIRARDEVLRVVSHDLRNPIGAMSMAASFLLEDGPPELREGTHGRMLKTIRSASEQATRMIDDLLDVSRIEVGHFAIEPAPEPIADLLMEAVELHRPLAQSRGIRLEWRVTSGLPPVMVDRGRVLQMMGNLLGNAIKFTPDGGCVEVGAESEGMEVRGWVADSGPGIPADHLPHLFDRFWQARRTDRRGLGLGLAIVRGIVEAHGGRVRAVSDLGTGSRFEFTLPAVKSEG
jgi:signal transduction histidine kinase